MFEEWNSRPEIGGSSPEIPDATAAIRARLEEVVQHLAGEIGSRTLFRETLPVAEKWITARWEDQGFSVRRQPVTSGFGTSYNLEVTVPGREPDLPAIVVGAHYDTFIDTPGADDNASGVAVLLELSRAMRTRALDSGGVRRTIHFVAFCNEEPPHFAQPTMGSLVHALALQEEGIAIDGMVSLESVGFYSSEPGSQEFPPGLSAFYPDTGDFIGFVGFISTGGWVDLWTETFRAQEVLPSESLQGHRMMRGVDWSDHRSYHAIGVPALMITDTAIFRNPHYHERTDTPDTLDSVRMTRLTVGLVDSLIAIADRPGS